MTSNADIFSLGDKELVPAGTADLSNCDREAIHNPAAIQPFGTVLAVESESGRISHAARNLENFFGVQVDQALGEPSGILGDDLQYNKLVRALETNSPTFEVTSQSGERLLLTPHISRSDLLMLEVEPRSVHSLESVLFEQLGYLIERLANSNNLEESAHFCCKAIFSALPADWVASFRFDDRFHGTVVAEAHREELRSYQGHWFPKQDIPLPARRLMRLRPVGMVADYQYDPIEIIAHRDAVASHELDLTQILVRSVSRFCSDYYLNMGVRAGLVCRCLTGTNLWGFFSVWRQQPTCWTLEQRNFLFATSILFDNQRQNLLTAKKVVSLTSLRKVLTEGRPSDSLELLKGACKKLAEEVSAEGYTFCLETDTHSAGLSLKEKELRALIEKVRERSNDLFFYTRNVREIFPDIPWVDDKVSGVMILFFGVDRRQFISFFKPPLVNTKEEREASTSAVDSLDLNDEDSRLRPEGSFALWQQEIASASSDWQDWQIEAGRSSAYDLASLIITRTLEFKVSLLRGKSQAEKLVLRQEQASTISQKSQALIQISTSLLDNLDQQIKAAQDLSTQAASKLVRQESSSTRLEELLERQKALLLAAGNDIATLRKRIISGFSET